MGNKDIVVIGGSTGGIEALQEVVRHISKDFNGSIFVVLHTAPSSPNVLDRVLSRAGNLPARIAKNWEEIRPAQVYVAPADYHLTLERGGRMRLSRGPKENRFRPAIDPLFRSAAQVYGPRAVGVVLTGFLDDGTAGLWAIKERGGTAIVQNPEEAIAPSMPLSALKNVEVDHIVRLAEVGPLLVRLSQEPAIAKPIQPMPKEVEGEIEIAREKNAIEAGIMEWGEPSVFACPECHGVLMQRKEGTNLRFRCHTGHAYSVEALLAEFTEHNEQTLWNAIRSLEETILLMRRMSEQLQKHGHSEAALTLMQKADAYQGRSEQVRELVFKPEISNSVPKQAA